MSDAPGPGDAPSFGRYLSQQRQLRGLTIENIADQTKLSSTHLRALEADDFEHLPQRVFVVGYVKAYAKCVGLDLNETVLRLEEAYSLAGLEPPEPAVPNTSNRRRRSVPRPPSRARWVVAAALAAAAWGLWRFTHG